MYYLILGNECYKELTLTFLTHKSLELTIVSVKFTFSFTN